MMKKYRINGKEYVAMDELLPDIASLIPMLTSNSRNHLKANRRSVEKILAFVGYQKATCNGRTFYPVDGLMLYMKMMVKNATRNPQSAASMMRDRVAVYNRALNQADITDVKFFHGGVGSKKIHKCYGPRFVDTNAYDVPNLEIALDKRVEASRCAQKILGFFEKKEPAYSFDAELKKLHDAKEELRRLQAQTKDKDAEVKELYGKLKEMLDKELKAA